MKVSTKKHRATIFKCILSSGKTFGEVVPKILLNAPLCNAMFDLKMAIAIMAIMAIFGHFGHYGHGHFH